MPERKLAFVAGIVYYTAMSDLLWNSVPVGEDERPKVELEALRELAADLDPDEFDEPVQSFLEELMKVDSPDALKQAATLLLQDEVDFSPELADLGVEPDMGLVELLIACGADVNALNAYGLAPLHLAARYGYEPIIDRLLAAGAKLDLRDREGGLAADYAVDPELAKRLEPAERGEWQPLPPEIEDADYVPDGDHGCDCQCGEHHGDHECHCGHHHG